MLYILVVCAGHLCLPVDSIGAYTLTQAECAARMMQVRGADVHCYWTQVGFCGMTRWCCASLTAA